MTTEGHKEKIGRSALDEAAGRPLFLCQGRKEEKSEHRGLIEMN